MLADLTAGAVEDAEARASARPLADVERAALAQPPALDALAALAPADGVKIIAEVKRASPSRGDLAEHPRSRATRRACTSRAAPPRSRVLTEGRRFKGSLADLEAVRAAVSLPVLRKDFIATRVPGARGPAAGADLVLLIVAALEQAVLAALHALVLELGMTPLVETHSADEVARAVDIGARLIGVNARDLSTFELDRDLFGRLVDRIPATRSRSPNPLCCPPTWPTTAPPAPTSC